MESYEADAYNEKFDKFGYSSYLAIQNMGLTTFMLIGSPIVVGVTLMMKYLSRKFKL